MKLVRFILIPAVLFLLPGSALSTAMAGELDTRIDKIVKRFVEASPGKVEGQATLAIFPFQTDEKLAKKRVGFAVSELLTYRLFQCGKFKLVERTQLQSVLKEQALGQTGVIERMTASKVGKLLGAQLSALGSVNRLGKSYQIVAKLVDTESGEILASEVQEVLIPIFDEEAAPYLVLVPEQQTIGLYITGAAAPVKKNDVWPVMYFGNTVKPANPKPGYTALGVGGRYSPHKNVILDLTYLFNSGYTYHTTGYSVFNDEYSPPSEIPMSIRGQAMRMTLNWTRKLTSVFRAYIGSGISVWWRNKDDSGRYTTTKSADNAALLVDVKGTYESGKYTTGLARLGLEWRPQARFGISAFGNYNFYAPEYTLTAHIEEYELVGTEGSSRIVTGEKDIDVYKFTFPRFVYETSLSLYF